MSLLQHYQCMEFLVPLSLISSELVIKCSIFVANTETMLDCEELEHVDNLPKQRDVKIIFIAHYILSSLYTHSAVYLSFF